MAEMISAERAAELALRPVGKRLGSRGFYPWSQWENGEWWHLIEGEDFTCTKKAMVTVIHNRAVRRGLTAEARRCDDGVIFRFAPGRVNDEEGTT